jgi:hypothetical protein
MSQSRHFRGLLPIAVAVLAVCVVVCWAAQPTAIYQPLKVGDSWTFNYTSYLGGTNKYTEVNSVTGTLAHGGATWFTVVATGVPGDPVTTYLRNAAAGLLTYSAYDPTPYYLLKAPLTTGSTWLMTVPAPTVAHRKIISTTATTTVPAGTFHNCLEVIQTYTAPSTMVNLKLTYWYAQNKGPVRWQMYMGTTLMQTGELKSCVIK